MWRRTSCALSFYLLNIYQIKMRYSFDVRRTVTFLFRIYPKIKPSAIHPVDNAYKIQLQLAFYSYTCMRAE